MTSRYKTETRHHPEGKTCHHFAYHGLTCDEYDALRARANGHCEICGIAEEETRRGSLVIDHCMAQGFHAVRGLLCDSCNIDVMRRYPFCNRWAAEANRYAANSWHPAARAAAAAQAERIDGRPNAG